MDVKILAGLIAAATTIVVVPLTHRLQVWIADRQQRGQINSQYLNPLRLYAEEVYFRLFEISFKPRSASFLRAVQDEKELTQQEDAWFTGTGCYLASSCYFTACLFNSITMVRTNIPYLRLGHKADTELLRQTFLVSRAFLQDLGIFYPIQHSIGWEMSRDGRLLTYREFCQLLKIPETRLWFDRLTRFYLDLASDDEKAWQRAQAALLAIWALSSCVDKAVGGGHSIETRLMAEHELPPLPWPTRALRFLSRHRFAAARNPALTRVPLRPAADASSPSQAREGRSSTGRSSR